jgi:hypothetical protein
LLKGYNLQGAVKLSVVNSTGGFTINKSNVTKAAANKGVEVIVTYNPTTIGNHSADVQLVVTGGETVFVHLDGTAFCIKANPVMQPADSAYLTNTSFRADWTDGTSAPGVVSYTLEYSTNGSSRSIPGIKNKYYMLENLTAGATYSYKVKTTYYDGTTSDWSNTQTITLTSAQTVVVGDVNNDGRLTISDVTDLISLLLSEGEVTPQADVNGDGRLAIADVTELISLLLNSTEGE